MLGLELPGGALNLLCLGAHSDDLEIGAGGTILQLAASGRLATVTWVVFSGTPDRVREGTASAEACLAGVADCRILFHDLPDGHFPGHWSDVKDGLEALKSTTDPGLIIAPRRDDAHQDHRLLGELALTTFRNHLILGYEIPKYDGDLGTPSVYVPLPEDVLERKIELIRGAFGSQAGRTWFDPETFRGLARLRGIEAGAGVRYAEAFDARKVRLELGGAASNGRPTTPPAGGPGR
jgi:LmbE family N-acetylglucosaminyl deacetylase